MGGGLQVAGMLEQANIMCSAFKLWNDDEPFYGIRLGTAEMTRYGMKQSEMQEIARFIRRVVIDGDNLQKVKRDVISFRRNFTQLNYCFH